MREFRSRPGVRFAADGEGGREACRESTDQRLILRTSHDGKPMEERVVVADNGAQRMAIFRHGLVGVRCLVRGRRLRQGVTPWPPYRH